MIGRIRKVLGRRGAGIAMACILYPCAAAQAVDVSRTERPTLDRAEAHETRRRLAGALQTAPTSSDKAFCAAIRTVDDLDERMALGARLSEFAEQRAKPLEALLQGADLERYRALIAQLECEAAQSLMLGPYLIAHPEHTCLFGNDRGESAWNVYIASKRYPELDLCGMERDFQRAVAMMERVDIEGPPYKDTQLGAERTDPWPLSSRNWTLFSLLTACTLDDYQPACVSYVRIALTTVHVALTDEGAYSLLERARMLIGDNPEIARLRAMVEPRLSPDMRKEITDFARNVIAREASTKPKAQLRRGQFRGGSRQPAAFASEAMLRRVQAEPVRARLSSPLIARAPT